MTIYEPNDEVEPTGQEPAEFIDPQEADEDVSDEEAKHDSSAASGATPTLPKP
jgi:hypothetical protein